MAERACLTRTRSDLLGASLAGLVVTLFCLLLLRHDPQIFWFDDYQLSILPVFADVARSWSERNWPLLSPYSWVCGNLAGEFQYGTFSVFVNAAVVLIWKFQLDFTQQAAALSIVHLVPLAMGGYMLARGRAVSAPLALMVGIVTALNGWMICWGASDWFGALAAFAWLPWAWWALERAVEPEARRARVLLPGIFIYLVIAGGFPYTVLMLALVTAWLAVRAIVTRGDWRATLRLGIGWLIGLGLSAPAWIALLDYAPGSRRAVEVHPAHQWLVPFSALPGLILPSWTVEWSMFGEVVKPHAAIELACGLGIMAVLIAAVIRAPRALFAKLRWEFALLIVVLVICMLPSAGMFRFSFRSLALFHVVLALIAADAFQLWKVNAFANRRGSFASNLGAWAVLLVALTAIADAVFGLPSLEYGPSLWLIFAIVAVIWWLASAFHDEATALHNWALPLVTFVTLLASYLALPLHGAVARFGLDANLNDVAPLDSDRLYLSIYKSPPEHYRGDHTGGWYGTITRPGSTSMFAGVHLINGYSPVGPAGISRLLDFGTHGHINPPRIDGVVLPEAGPDGLLEKLGIDGILVASDAPLPSPLPGNWTVVYGTWEGDVWHRDVPLPHVRPLADERHAGASVKIIENSRQRVIADVTSSDPSQPVLLTFSRPYFPGYRATLDGKPLTVTSLNGLAPTVELAPGQSGRVTMVYRPRAVTLGGAICGLTIAAAALASWQMSRRDRLGAR
jgi:hypothetical protein